MQTKMKRCCQCIEEYRFHKPDEIAQDRLQQQPLPWRYPLISYKVLCDDHYYQHRCAHAKWPSA